MKRWAANAQNALNSPSKPNVPETSSEGEVTRAFLQIPMWLLVGIMSVGSLVCVGVLAYFLVYNRTETAMDKVALSYRQLGFLAVQNKVVGTLSPVATTTQQLALMMASTLNSGLPFANFIFLLIPPQ